jgi:hypothetical protein
MTTTAARFLADTPRPPAINAMPNVLMVADSWEREPTDRMIAVLPLHDRPERGRQPPRERQRAILFVRRGRRPRPHHTEAKPEQSGEGKRARLHPGRQGVKLAAEGIRLTVAK